MYLLFSSSPRSRLMTNDIIVGFQKPSAAAEDDFSDPETEDIGYISD